MLVAQRPCPTQNDAQEQIHLTAKSRGAKFRYQAIHTDVLVVGADKQLGREGAVGVFRVDLGEDEPGARPAAVVCVQGRERSLVFKRS